jgi:hypothetical protein
MSAPILTAIAFAGSLAIAAAFAQPDTDSPPAQSSSLVAKAGEYDDMIRLTVVVGADGDRDMCVMAAALPPDNKHTCIIQYRTGGTLVFPRGFAISIVRENP